ncbi:hypothetical protein [Kitasatospora sp. NPDC047058]
MSDGPEARPGRLRDSAILSITAEERPDCRAAPERRLAERSSAQQN